MNILDIFKTAAGLIISLRAARQMTAGTDLEIDIPDFRVDVSGKHYMVEAMKLHRAAPADPSASHVVTGTLDIVLEILASIQLSGMELEAFNVGDDQAVDSPDVAIGYKGVRYDITALRVKRVA